MPLGLVLWFLYVLFRLRQEYSVTFPLVAPAKDAEAGEELRAKWGVRSLPWLVLTDREHIVRAEGFGVDEVDDKLPGTNPTSSEEHVSQVLTGRVVTEDGKGIADARVLLYYNRNHWGLGNRVADETRTGGDGGFSLSGLIFDEPTDAYGTSSAGEYWVFATHGDTAVGWVKVTEEKTPPRIELVLGEPGTCTARVVDEEGSPVAGARVWLHQAGDRQDKRPFYRDHFYVRDDLDLAAGVTGPDGLAAIGNLPDTSLSFFASKEGYSDTWRGGRRLGADIRFPLTREGILRGRVTYGDTGKGAAGVVVWLSAEWSFHHYEWALTDSDGRYEFRKVLAEGWDKEWFAPNGGSGSYKVTLDAREKESGYAAVGTTVQLAPGEVIEGFDMVPDRGFLLTGTVKAADGGFGLAGCNILVIRSPIGRKNITTDARGRFRFRSVPGEVGLFLQDHLPPAGYVYPRDRESEMVVGREHTIDLQEDTAGFDLSVPVLKEVTLAIRTVDADRRAQGDVFVQSNARQVQYATNRKTVDGDGRIAFRGFGEGEKAILHARTLDRKAAAVARVTVHEGAPETVLALTATRTVRVAVKRPDGTPAEVYSANVKAEGGRADIRLPFALNDPLGTWRVRVQDVATGTAAEAGIRLRGAE